MWRPGRGVLDFDGIFPRFAGSPPVTFPIPLPLLWFGVRIDSLPFPRNFSFPYPLPEACVTVDNRRGEPRLQSAGQSEQRQRSSESWRDNCRPVYPGPVEFPRYIFCLTGLGLCFAARVLARQGPPLVARESVCRGMTGSRCWPPGRTSLLWRTG